MPAISGTATRSPPRAKGSATARAKRPHDFDSTPQRHRGRFCPFCEGNENATPDEIIAYRTPGSKPNGPGWRVRVFANKFPALGIEGEVDREGVAAPADPADPAEATLLPAVVDPHADVDVAERDGEDREQQGRGRQQQHQPEATSVEQPAEGDGHDRRGPHLIVRGFVGRRFVGQRFRRIERLFFGASALFFRTPTLFLS